MEPKNIKRNMMYLENYENYSRDYYNEFNLDDFPNELIFEEPKKVVYGKTKVIPGSNFVQLQYDLTSDQPNEDNPYQGNVPPTLKIEFGITYSSGDDSETKTYFTVNGGSRSWLSFSVENGKLRMIEESRWKISSKSFKEVKKLINKYSTTQIN